MKSTLSTFKVFILISLSGFVISGCKSRKLPIDSNVVLTQLPDGAEQKLAKSYFNLESLSLKIKATYTDGQSSQSFMMNAKMVKDSFLWVSITAFNIEVARALISSDSFKLINRLNKSYCTGDIDMLGNFTNQKFSLGQLQQLLIGNAIYSSQNYVKSHDELRNDFLNYSDSTFKNYLQLTEGYRIKKSELQSVGNNRDANVDYDQFVKVKKSGSLPSLVKLMFKDDDRKMELLMNYISISIDPIEQLSFTIPAKYEKKC
ncbi:MAG: DUF4292 domain-containing protein [Bacteroidetes bacterium]|nr:DUF4292 domain-containing protein [Bacteroidota bacterium]